jgi:nucleolar protein 56
MGDKGNEIMKQLEGSTGIDMTSKDLAEIKQVAQEVLALTALQEHLDTYMEGIAREVCPNMSEVGGAKIAAKLVAHVGGIERLAKLPASTVQVLGAEKALFKHLKKKTKPPKHGIIFQNTEIHSAPKEQRGRISRALAAKLAIAAKADAYTKRFIGKELREDFERRLKEIKEGKQEGKQ